MVFFPGWAKGKADPFRFTGRYFVSLYAGQEGVLEARLEGSLPDPARG